jgi:nucleoside phosphorylase
VGDVVVATQVDNYLEGAKVSVDAGQPQLLRADDTYRADHQLLESVRHFEFTSRASFKAWQAAAAQQLKAVIADIGPLVRQQILRPEPQQFEGPVASGPLVVANPAFLTWIRQGNRACKALEMESGGVVTSAHMNAHGVRALILRGISDCGDERKAMLDAIEGGALRRLAMENAVEFLWALLRSGILPRSARTPAGATIAQGDLAGSSRLGDRAEAADILETAFEFADALISATSVGSRRATTPHDGSVEGERRAQAASMKAEVAERWVGMKRYADRFDNARRRAEVLFPGEPAQVLARFWELSTEIRIDQEHHLDLSEAGAPDPTVFRKGFGSVIQGRIQEQRGAIEATFRGLISARQA